MRLGKRNLKIESYFLGALLGPLLIMVFGILDYNQVINGLKGGHGLNPCGILILFLSMVFMSIFLDITGFFECCARLALKWAGSDGKRLFFSLYIMVSLLTIFTSNDIIILTFTPFIYYFARSAQLDPKPYLIAEFFAANTWSMMLYIGNPTNILLAAAFGLRFDRYFKWMFFPTLAAGLVSVFGLFVIFRKSISMPITVNHSNSRESEDPERAVREDPERVVQLSVQSIQLVQPLQLIQPVQAVQTIAPINPFDALTDKPGAVLGLVLLGGCIFALAIAPRLGFEMWDISFAFAFTLFVILMVRDSSAAWLRRKGINGLNGKNDKNGEGMKSRKGMEGKKVTENKKDTENKKGTENKNRFTVGSTLRKMPWTVVPFVLSLFITVEALHLYGVTSEVGHFFRSVCGTSSVAYGLIYGVSSALSANFLNNIPMTVAFVSVIHGLSGRNLLAAALATAAGSNLGANLTPIGALAGIMWMSILNTKDFHLSFREFVYYGLLITPLTLIACLGVLALELAVW
jgi:arsenical pump membrane protein